MSIYAIADLHLSLNNEKPMNVFGNEWTKHECKIKDDWITKVKENDLVLLPGDFSWKMNLKDMYEDFEYINELPGKKILLKGNHDYWWETLTKMREFIKSNQFKNIDFLYNNSYEYENYIIVGARGWALNDKDEGERMHHRELERLKLSLENSLKKEERTNISLESDLAKEENILLENTSAKEIICMMHFPPIKKEEIEYSNNYINLMKEYNVKTCLYGHLHGHSHEEAFEGEYQGINFKLVSADYLNFKLYKIS